MSDSNFEEAYPHAKRAAAVRSRAAARICGLSEADREDLEQDLLLGIYRALPRFDNRALLRTFVERIAENRLADILRHRRRSIQSIEPTDLPRAKTASIHLRIDVNRVIRTLPRDHQSLCQLLTEHSVTEISRRAGVSRPSIYRKIHRLRLVFTEAGLQGWLPGGVGS